jgi:hypothetical protein
MWRFTCPSFVRGLTVESPAARRGAEEGATLDPLKASL